MVGFMRIIITGSPGTGKSSIALKLSKLLKIPIIDLKSIVKKHRLAKGKESEVDIPKLRKFLLSDNGPVSKSRNYIIEGHLACEMKIPADFIIVLRTNPTVLKGRLTKRGYKKFKIEENLMAEMLDYCSQRVCIVYNKKHLELDTSKLTPVKAAKIIQKTIKQKKKKLDIIDYTKELKKTLSLGYSR